MTSSAATPPPLVLNVPGSGLWQARNSPALRVPGNADRVGAEHALDLVPVDQRGHSGPITWRTVVATEDPRRFAGFGRPVTAPIAGRVVVVHDGEPDVVARRSPLARLGQDRRQAGRALRGLPGLAGNCVVIEVAPDGPYVVVGHLRHWSVTVRKGATVVPTQVIGECGNSGNTVQPQVHLQVVDSLDWPNAAVLPLALAAYRTRRGPLVTDTLPREAEIIEGVVLLN